MASLAQLATYIDARLNIAGVPDYPGAVNGVQLANLGEIERIASAVDFSSFTTNAAINAGARLLLVHHGMFWSGVQPITGLRHQRLWSLITHDVAVYSAHLPLDVHPEIGNNALLAKRLGLVASGGFARYQTIDVGLQGAADVPTSTIVERASQLAREHEGAIVVTPFEDGRTTKRWAMCTGAGASSAAVREALDAGVDTLIVGEGPHHTAVEARDNELVIIYAGHYATETLGVRALGDELAATFALEATFIDAPTGL